MISGVGVTYHHLQASGCGGKGGWQRLSGVGWVRCAAYSRLPTSPLHDLVSVLGGKPSQVSVHSNSIERRPPFSDGKSATFVNPFLSSVGYTLLRIGACS